MDAARKLWGHSTPTAMAVALKIPILLAVALSAAVCASPPKPAVTCTSGNQNCTLSNAYGAFSDRSTCLISAVAYPSDEAELLRIVSSAAAKKQHVKAVTEYAHSMPKLSCPGGPSGSGLAISTRKLNKVVDVDTKTERMAVESGMLLRDFIDAAAAEGLALPNSPYWEGVTIGGLLATGTHGSSLFGKGSAVHEYVVEMRVVVPTASPTPDGLYAEVFELKEGDKDLLAAKVSLGTLGVISQITLQLQPMFKRSITYREEVDEGFESKIAAFGANTEFGDMAWFPSQFKVLYREDFRLPITAKGEGTNSNPFFDAAPATIWTAARRTEDTHEALGNATGVCLATKSMLSRLHKFGSGLKNDGVNFHGYPVIGFQNDMQGSASCLNSDDEEDTTMCNWDPRIDGTLFYNTAFSIPLATIPSFVADVKKLRDSKPSAFCGIDSYIGFSMRFVRNSTAYLGKPVESVEVDMLYYRSRDPSAPRLHQDFAEEIEQMAFFKYGALPHFGKNRNVAFLGLREKLGWKADEFVEVMRRFDPEGLLSSDWTDAVLGLRQKSVVVERQGCAMDGLCICSKDEHCAPTRGYRCRAGIVYKKARVCRKDMDVSKGLMSPSGLGVTFLQSICDHQ